MYCQATRFVSEKSVLSNGVWSMLTKLFRSVRSSLLYKEQWRKKWIADSTSLPQLHIRFSVSWKLCLNLCSYRWLRPSGIRVIYLILIGLWQSQNELEEGRMNFSMLLLKIFKWLVLVSFWWMLTILFLSNNSLNFYFELEE